MNKLLNLVKQNDKIQKTATRFEAKTNYVL
jgi:hypothetical protein